MYKFEGVSIFYSFRFNFQTSTSKHILNSLFGMYKIVVAYSCWKNTPGIQVKVKGLPCTIASNYPFSFIPLACLKKLPMYTHEWKGCVCVHCLASFHPFVYFSAHDSNICCSCSSVSSVRSTGGCQKDNTSSAEQRTHECAYSKGLVHVASIQVGVLNCVLGWRVV